MEVYYSKVNSPVGLLTLVATEKGICRIEFGYHERTILFIEAWLKKHQIRSELREDAEPFIPVIKQLEEYFLQKRRQFQLPLDVYGTDFQKRVWKALQQIPYGKTCSYKEIANQIGSQKAVRAVGNANNHNPLPLIIPCHRVIGTNGAMVGYAGGLPIKEKLLELESTVEKISS